MKKITGNKEITPRNYGSLLERIAHILIEARGKVVREINRTQVLAYWEIGREIVEYEQKGKERAEYGAELIIRLSQDMTKKFGRGFSERNLEQMRKFYILFSQIPQTVSAESQKSQTVSDKFEPKLSWSHYCELLKVEEPLARKFYEQEAIKTTGL
ncbi:MAG: DUF1016 N-terminal domain-containing protein [Proteobacteria bacterium]|nr:DUF1016 N-terminal domain-containing protein [Pseudomonadota bacterium]